MSNIYTLGENEPFKISKESSFKLVSALINTNSTLIYAGIDSTCPKTHGIFRIRVENDKLKEFEAILSRKLDELDIIEGQNI